MLTADLMAACAPEIHPTTLLAIVATESSHQPFAIGVVDGRLARQPRTRSEAIATARALQRAGWTFAAGYGQINVRNWARLGLDAHTVFDACANLRALQTLLRECFGRATAHGLAGQTALDGALGCYYSGQLSARHGAYVQRVRRQVSTPNMKYSVTP